MTNQELIATIRNEIERLYGDNHNHADRWDMGYDAACEKMLDFLDTLESEKPMQEGLEEEMDKFFETMPVLEHENIFEDTFKNIARHFAQWGAEHLKK